MSSLKNLVTINPAILSVYPTSDKEVLLAAIEKDAETTFRILKDKANDMIGEAVKKNGKVLQYSTKFTREICLDAVKQNGDALEYVPVTFQDDEIIMEAIKSSSYAIRFAYNANTDHWIAALEDDLFNFKYINKKDIDVFLYVAARNPEIIKNCFLKGNIDFEFTADELDFIEAIENENDKFNVISAYTIYVKTLRLKTKEKEEDDEWI